MKERIGSTLRNQALAKVMLFGGLLLVGHESYREANAVPLPHDSISVSMEIEGIAGGMSTLGGVVMLAAGARRRYQADEATETALNETIAAPEPLALATVTELPKLTSVAA